MSRITGQAAIQAQEMLNQAEVEEQQAHGDDAVTGEQKHSVDVEGTNTAATGEGDGQHAEGQTMSKLDKVEEALHLRK